MDEPSGSIDPTTVHGPAILDELAYEISFPVENRKYLLSEDLWISVGSETTHCPEHAPGLAYPCTSAVKSATGRAKCREPILLAVKGNDSDGSRNTTLPGKLDLFIYTSSNPVASNIGPGLIRGIRTLGMAQNG